MSTLSIGEYPAVLLAVIFIAIQLIRKLTTAPPTAQGATMSA
jgi:hypothetical protein